MFLHLEGSDLDLKKYCSNLKNYLEGYVNSLSYLNNILAGD